MRKWCFILILTGLVCLSCEEPKTVGLELKNNAAIEYRFTGNFKGTVDFDDSFDKVIQPGKSYNYDNEKSSLYGNFEVHVYDPEDSSTKLKSTTVTIPQTFEGKSVKLSWDGTSFSR